MTQTDRILADAIDRSYGVSPLLDSNYKCNILYSNEFHLGLHCLPKCPFRGGLGLVHHKSWHSLSKNLR